MQQRKGFLAQKTPENSIKKTENRSDTLKGVQKRNCTDLWDRGSIGPRPDTLIQKQYRPAARTHGERVSRHTAAGYHSRFPQLPETHDVAMLSFLR